MNQTAFHKARQEISARRVSAQAEQERRCEEIAKKIPQISEINHQLSQSIFKILNGEDIKVIQKKNLDAQQYCSRLLIEKGYPGDYLDIHYTCSHCNDTGYAENGQYCSCLTELVASYAVADMHKQSQIRLCTFEEFSLEYYRGHTCYSDMKKILDICQKYAFNFSLHSPSMLFYGNVGTGKTHLSLSIVSEVLKKGYHVIYDSVGNLLTKVENEHFRNSNSETNTLELLLCTDLLVLDDLGT
ncbi:MAG: ATP-binding protein [Oscillospiraceae bacterium]|nr:ATP-binding protein [Oscillospiraceae bacterium]